MAATGPSLPLGRCLHQYGGIWGADAETHIRQHPTCVLQPYVCVEGPQLAVEVLRHMAVTRPAPPGAFATQPNSWQRWAALNKAGLRAAHSSLPKVTRTPPYCASDACTQLLLTKSWCRAWWQITQITSPLPPPPPPSPQRCLAMGDCSPCLCCLHLPPQHVDLFRVPAGPRRV